MKIGKQTRIRLNAGAALIAAMALCGGTALVAAPPGPKPAEKREFSYFLPRTALAVEISQELNSCPKPDPGTQQTTAQKPDFATTITVTAQREADPAGMVRLDVGPGFLAKRTVKLGLNPDGTLASFNSQSEGQAGTAIAAAAKLALKIATVPLAPAQGEPLVECTDETSDLMGKAEKLSDRIKALEALIENGQGGAAQTSLLADLRARYAKARTKLTITAALPFPLAPAKIGDRFDLQGPSLAAWYKASIPNTFALKVIGDPNLPTTLFEGDGTELSDEAQPDVLYRKGVPGIVLVVETGKQQCLVHATPGEVIACVNALETGSVTRAVFPQFSKPYAIRAGKGGMFGSRQAGITFDANGVPASLEYGSAGASAAITSLADAASDGIQGISDAPLAGLNREIALAEARAKLKKLRADEAAAKAAEEAQ